MKKIIAIGLTTLLIICNSMTVWAATTTWDGTTYSGDSNTQNVTATFQKSASSTYNVTIMWGELSYIYDGTVSWDGNSVYNATNESNTVWNVDETLGVDDTITVTNASDKKVKATFSFDEDNIYLDAEASTIVGSFTDGDNNVNVTDLTLGSAAIAGSGEIQNTMALALSGVPNGIKPVVGETTVDFENTGIKVGTVTVTLEGIN